MVMEICALASFIKHILSKVNRYSGLLHKLQLVLPRSSLLTIHKTFTRSHVAFDQSYKTSSHESIQYNAALATIGTIRGFSSEKFARS